MLFLLSLYQLSHSVTNPREYEGWFNRCAWSRFVYTLWCLTEEAVCRSTCLERKSRVLSGSKRPMMPKKNKKTKNTTIFYLNRSQFCRARKLQAFALQMCHTSVQGFSIALIFKEGWRPFIFYLYQRWEDTWPKGQNLCREDMCGHRWTLIQVE